MIKIELIPSDVPPSELRALALFLNTLAHERDGGAKPSVEHIVRAAQAGAAAGSALAQLQVADSGNAPDTGPAAAGASGDSSPEPDAGAPDDSNTSEGLDAKGLPWDGRIHSSSKNKNSDGSWRYLRGVDKDLIGIVEAELRQLTSNDAPPPPPPVVEQPKADDVPPPPPPPVETPTADAPPPPPPVAPGVSMQDVFKRVTHLQQSGDSNRMPQDLLNGCLATVGLSSMAEFMKQSKLDAELAGNLMQAINLVAGED